MHPQDPDVVGQDQESTLLTSKQGGGFPEVTLRKTLEEGVGAMSCGDTKIFTEGGIDGIVKWLRTGTWGYYLCDVWEYHSTPLSPRSFLLL